jgi:phosphoglycolate phosphatase
MLRNLKSKLIIFDKDGTLISYNKLWIPWINNTLNHLKYNTGVSINNNTLIKLGYDKENNIIRHNSMLKSSSMELIKNVFITELINNGLSKKKSISETNYVFTNILAKSCLDNIYPLIKLSNDNISRSKMNSIIKDTLINIKYNNDAYFAIITSDTQKNTNICLDSMNIRNIFDFVLPCDVSNSYPKPNPKNITYLCDMFNIDVFKNCIVIGDSNDDMDMGRNANVFKTIGICQENDSSMFKNNVDIYIDTIQDLDKMCPIKLWK